MPWGRGGGNRVARPGMQLARRRTPQARRFARPSGVPFASHDGAGVLWAHSARPPLGHDRTTVRASESTLPLPWGAPIEKALRLPPQFWPRTGVRRAENRRRPEDRGTPSEWPRSVAHGVLMHSGVISRFTAFSPFRSPPMHPFSAIAKRVLVSASLLALPMLTACSGSITEPQARQSGYLTVSASVAPSLTTTAPGSTKLPIPTTSSGYNVTAY